MLKGGGEEDIAEIVEKLSSRETYASHGSTIDCNEAASIGLKVDKLSPEDMLWRKI